jgi:hypothetical protein
VKGMACQYGVVVSGGATQLEVWASKGDCSNVDKPHVTTAPRD